MCQTIKCNQTRIPGAVDVLALFIARTVVDDILLPAFLNKYMASLPIDSKRAKKCYLVAPFHAEIFARKWGGSKNKNVEDVKANINNLLLECVVSSDKKETCRCIKELKVPFFHHEIIKRALLIVMGKLAG